MVEPSNRLGAPVSDLERHAQQMLAAWHDESQVYVLSDGGVSFGTPFSYGDGDGMPCVLQREGESWVLTDRGAAASHLYFDFMDAGTDMDDHPDEWAFVRRLAKWCGAECSDFLELKMRYEQPPTNVDLADFLQLVCGVQAVVALHPERRARAVLRENREPQP